MATFQDLVRQTEGIIDDSFDTINYIDWFNECQDDLIDVVFLPTIVELTIQPQGYFLLPDDYKDGFLITTTEENAPFLDLVGYKDKTTVGYKHFSNRIYLQGLPDVTTVEVYYNRLPERFGSDPTFVPEFPTEYHYLFPLYAAMKAMLMEEEEDRYEMFKNDYTVGKIQTLRNIRKKYKRDTFAWQVIR
jgi:hypothetical protein